MGPPTIGPSRYGKKSVKDAMPQWARKVTIRGPKSRAGFNPALVTTMKRTSVNKHKAESATLAAALTHHTI